MSLSDTQCRAATKKEKPYKLADGEGLYLEVMPSGSKYWRLKYRLRGKEKRISLGTYPKVSLVRARVKKAATREELANGFDPLLSRQERNQTRDFSASQTFESVAMEWYNNNVPQWDPKSAKNSPTSS